MAKIVFEEFAKELQLIKVVAYGDHSTGLFGGHKGFYDGLWLLTSRYFKNWLLISKNNKFLSKKNISFASNVDWKKNIRQRIASFTQLTSAEWRSLLFMQSKCLYIISSFQEKKETPTKMFSLGICETSRNSSGFFWKHVTLLRKQKLCRA